MLNIKLKIIRIQHDYAKETDNNNGLINKMRKRFRKEKTQNNTDNNE